MRVIEVCIVRYMDGAGGAFPARNCRTSSLLLSHSSPEYGPTKIRAGPSVGRVTTTAWMNGLRCRDVVCSIVVGRLLRTCSVGHPVPSPMY